MSRATMSSLLCTAVIAMFSVSQLGAQQLTQASFRTNTQMVLVPVNVTDHYGKTIEGLRAQDFAVFDDQYPQPIASFTNEDAPCSVGLVLDISGSMRYALNTTKAIAQAFFKTANPDDEFLMLTVSTLPDAAAGFTRDTDALQQN